MANRWLLLLTALLLMAQTSRTAKTSTAGAALSPTKLSADGEKWVAQTLKSMTLEEKLGQLVMVFYYGGFLAAESPGYKDLLRQVEQNHLGGFVVQTRGAPLGIERSQVYPTAVLANHLQSPATITLLIGPEFERGTALRLDVAWKKMARWPPRSISPATEIPARIHTSICPLSAEIAPASSRSSWRPCGRPLPPGSARS